EHEVHVESVLLVIAAFLREIQRPDLASTRWVVDRDFLELLRRSGESDEARHRESEQKTLDPHGSPFITLFDSVQVRAYASGVAQIICGLGTSHGPMLSMPPKFWPERVKADRANLQHFFKGNAVTFDELVDFR